MLSRIAILLLKSYFERGKIILQEKNLKYRKIIFLTNFIFDPTFFHIASYQIWKNYAILINYESLFINKLLNLIIIYSFSKIGNGYSLNMNQSNFHWLNQWFAFSLIHQWKNIFTVKSLNFHWLISGKNIFYCQISHFSLK